ncbi:alpha/beta fold hydrolase [Agrococcus sp. SGAir0287]|uniref:alpha/beta fold hydrolase n=1 Tax=Agrococcus sp. SGAir0287 TaxID=2070347 RepID=UPI0010CD64A9|nr:alpha/beta hydrolase [Agrococcus sp. SGAir0287]QCR19229.1 alpha/beta hydrolase [Agrococcus sp. SGAir0287]
MVDSPFQELLDATPVARETGVVDGIRTVWFAYGDPADPPIVLVHGYRGDHHGLETIAAHLVGRHVLVPDLPGFGESDAAGDAGIATYASWLVAFVAAHAPGAPVLGHSFGSIVVAAAAAHGLDAERIVLVNPIAQPALEGPQRLLSRFTLGWYRAAAAAPERVGHAMLASPVVVRGMSVVMTKSRDRAMRRWIHDQHDRYFSAFASRASVVDGFETSISTNVGHYAAAIAQPVLLVVADRDDITPLAAQRELATRFGDARIAVLHGTGHLVHYEQPDQVAARVRRFLAEAPAA